MHLTISEKVFHSLSFIQQMDMVRIFVTWDSVDGLVVFGPIPIHTAWTAMLTINREMTMSDVQKVSLN